MRQGRLLKSVRAFLRDAGIYKLLGAFFSEKRFMGLLKDKRLISFDAFDTLIYRKCIYPEGIFKELALRYRRALLNGQILGAVEYDKLRQYLQRLEIYPLRVAAEKKARARAKQVGAGDITFVSLYNELERMLRQYIQRTVDRRNVSPGLVEKLSSQVREFLQKTELELELENIVPYPPGKRMYELALEYKKEVVVLSDMYLPRQFVIELLQKAGYTGFLAVKVSSEDGATKARGEAYSWLIDFAQQRGIPVKGILHVGDNLHSDIFMAVKKGITAFYLVPIRHRKEVTGSSRSPRC